MWICFPLIFVLTSFKNILLVSNKWAFHFIFRLLTASVQCRGLRHWHLRYHAASLKSCTCSNSFLEESLEFSTEKKKITHEWNYLFSLQFECHFISCPYLLVYWLTGLFKWKVFPFSHIYIIKLHVKCHIQFTFKEY